jgi:Caudovirus prohead serine protease
MEEKAKPDFSGYATKAGLKCSDGRTIMKDAFAHQDKTTVPLVWQHTHSEPGNVLGHGVLENRDDGVYVYGYFNDTDAAKNAKTLVGHKDITSLSIYANQLTEKAKAVLHGYIREVSLVLSGANPGALIDNISIAHADGDVVTLEDEAIIYTGLELNHADGSASDPANTGDVEDDVENSTTVQEVYDSMTPEQQAVVHYMVGAALEGESGDDASHSSDDESGKKELVHDDNEKEGRRMTRNVFEQTGAKKEENHTLTHDAMKGIFADAQRIGSLKQAVEAYALKHGIENIDVLFPEVRTITDTPEFDSRRVEWVKGVLGGARKSPFTRIKSLVADLTFDEARAKGYIKGNLKKEEFISASKRITTPTTIYKKQKLDRDDILDITDFNVVTWLQGEMRLMLDEELARAVLIGDGRDPADEDHILDPVGAPQGAGIRSIMNDDDLYAATVNVNLADANSSPSELVDEVIRSMRLYKGSGSPTFYTTLPVITTMLLVRDTLGRRIYNTVADIASEMGVSAIVACQALEDEPDLLGIVVNLTDYTIGTDAGGEVNFFDFFDIDYNQYKYLLETRVSGALTKIRSALVLKSVAGSATLVTPTEPAFDGTTITVPTVAGATYKRADTNATVTTAVPVVLASGQSLKIYAVPADASHYFENNVDDEWTFTNEN